MVIYFVKQIKVEDIRFSGKQGIWLDSLGETDIREL